MGRRPAGLGLVVNPLPFIAEVKGSILTPCKWPEVLLEAVSLSKDRGKIVYILPPPLLRGRRNWGLEWHLNSSHDLFNYECWVNEDYQVVVVSAKTNACTSEILESMVDPREQPFFFCHKPLKRRIRNQNANHVGPLALVSNMPETLSELRGVSEHNECETYRPNVAGGSGTSGIIFARQENAAETVARSSIAPTALLQPAKSSQLSIELSDFKSLSLLEKRCFFHSRSAQPMALEEVFAEEDSEDEVDDDVADLEDRWMLDDFVDVTQDEKQLMHLWNSFTRKQRVLADAHIPWACEAFSSLHGEDLLQTPQLKRSWRFILVKLWNHGLLDAKTVNNCQMIVDNYNHHLHHTQAHLSGMVD